MIIGTEVSRAFLRSSAQACSKKTNLVFLDQTGLVQLGGGTVLIGGQGWGDGQAGLGEKSPVTSRDRQLIQEFTDKPREKYFQMLQEMGRASASAFSEIAVPALESSEHLILATHVRHSRRLLSGNQNTCPIT